MIVNIGYYPNIYHIYPLCYSVYIKMSPSFFSIYPILFFQSPPNPNLPVFLISHRISVIKSKNFSFKSFLECEIPEFRNVIILRFWILYFPFIYHLKSCKPVQPITTRVSSHLSLFLDNQSIHFLLILSLLHPPCE